MRAGVIVCFLLWCHDGAIGQDVLRFDVASVKLHPEEPGPRTIIMKGGPGTEDPENYRWIGMPLSGPIWQAYGVKGREEIAEPGWVGTTLVDIVAKVPARATKDEFNLMLQTLLAERFHLSVHYVKKDLPYYELSVGKGGSKLKASSGEAAVPKVTSVVSRGTSVRGPKVSLALLVGLIQMGEGGHRVEDKTGLMGVYDISLDFRPIAWDTSPENSAKDLPFPNIFTAVQEQLGLKLEAKTALWNVLVIDHIDRIPTEN